MDPSFGVRLRSVREQQRIALTTIAEQTKIKLSLLEALERDDVSQWPRGIFGRSHLRAYAQAVGLDPDTVVGEFLEVHPDPDEEIPAILDAVQRGDGESANRPPRTRIRFLFDSAIDAVQGRRHQREPAAAAGPRPQHEPDRSSGTPTGLIATDEQAPEQRTTADIESELTSLAQLCARIGSAQALHEVAPVLEDALDLIDAVGLVLWLGDHDSGFLTPVLALGYSNNLIARLPRVPRDADNAIAAAVRSGETKIVDGSDVKTGAVAVPVVTAGGCVGALAVELRSRGERRAFVCAFASILTAQLAGLVGPLLLGDRELPA
jgi:transcriptional regulator with XRE-family HTH domain